MPRKGHQRKAPKNDRFERGGGLCSIGTTQVYEHVFSYMIHITVLSLIYFMSRIVSVFSLILTVPKTIILITSFW